MQQLPLAQLAEILSAIASAPSLDRLQAYADFWPPEMAELKRSVQGGVAELMEHAQLLDLGWDLNHGWRCDVPFTLFRVAACDNYLDRTRAGEITAQTAEGALAGAILLMLQLRAADDPDGVR